MKPLDGGETAHMTLSSVSAKHLTGGGGNILNWGKSSRRLGRNVLKIGAKRLGGGGRNVYGAKCPGAVCPTVEDGPK